MSNRTTLYPAKWCDSGVFLPQDGEPAFMVQETRLSEPDRRGNRYGHQNYVSFRWEHRTGEGLSYGTRQAFPGEVVTASQLFGDVPEAERSARMQSLIECRALFPLGEVASDFPYMRVRFTADGLRHVYRFAEMVRRFTMGTPREGEDVYQVVERFPDVAPSVRRPEVSRIGRDDRLPFPWMFTASTISRDPDDPERIAEAEEVIRNGVAEGRFKAVGVYEGGAVVFTDRQAERFMENEAMLSWHQYQSADGLDDFREYRRILEADAEERRTAREVAEARAQLDQDHPELTANTKAKKPRKSSEVA